MPKTAGTRYVLLAALLAMIAAVLLPATPAAAVPPPPPGGLSAVDVGDTNRRLVWNPVAGANTYNVQIADNAGFSDAISQTTRTTSFAPPTELPAGTVHWRVRVTTSDGTSDFATSSYEKVLVGPGLLGPADGATLDFPTNPPSFSWTSIETARSYRLEVDDAPDFIGAQSYVTSATNWTLNATQAPGQAYYWRVRGSSTTNGGGVLTNWSTTRSYNVTWDTTATLVKPTNGSTVTDVELEWTPVPGASRYNLQASVNEDFTGSFAINAEVYETRYSPPTTLNNGSYWWRVQAVDIQGRAGEWSVHEPTGKPFLFTRGWPDKPVPVYPFAPAGGIPATQTDPTRFEWTPVRLASHYELQVSTDEAFSPANVVNCLTTHTVVTPSDSDGPGGCDEEVWAPFGQQRWWRVRGIDGASNVQGLFSDIHTFVRQPEAYPTLVSPADGSSVAVPTLDWLPLDQSQQYRITILKANGSQAVSTVTLNTSYTPTSLLDPAEGPFKWYVVGIDRYGNQGQFPTVDNPAWFEFSLDPFPPSEALPNQQTPDDGVVAGEIPSFSWTPVTGADRYRVVYRNAGVPTEFNFVPSGTVRYPAFTPTNTLSAGNYQWRVLAYNGGTQVAASGLRTFTVSNFNAVVQHPPDPCDSHVNCTVTSSPMLEWDPVPHANYYEVTLAFDANFTNIYRTYEVPFYRFRPHEEIRDSDAGEVYYWHVRPCTTASRCAPDPVGTLAPSQGFRKVSDPVRGLANPVSERRLPANGAAVKDEPRFQWANYQGSRLTDVEARGYRIQISTVPAFTSNLVNKVVDQPFFTPYDVTLPEGPLYWRVRAIDGSGNELTWSEAWSLTKAADPLTPVLPANLAVIGGQPTFTWQGQNGADSYWIEVYTNDPNRTFSGFRNVRVQTAHTSYTPGVILPVGDDYSWRIAREDSQGRLGPWNAGRNFDITGAAPTLVSPNTGAEFTTPDIVFDWNPSSRATQYRIQTSDDNFNSTRENVTTVMTTWSTTTTYGAGDWSWRVLALDPAGNVLGISPTRTFERIVVPLPTAPRNLIATPSAGSLRLTWQAPAENGTPAFTSYEIRVTRNTGPEIVRTVSSSATSLTLNGLTNGDEHQVSIRAKAGIYFGPPATDDATPNGCSGTPFSDVSSGHVFCPNIRWMYEEGITVGSILTDGRVLYQPSASVSRQSMAAFIYRYDGEPVTDLLTQRFDDVEGDNAFYEPIQWMYNDGLSLGTPNPQGGLPLYRPQDLVSRQSMAAFVHRYDDGGVTPLSSPQEFPDVGPSNPFFMDIQWMGQTGLSTGSPNPPGDPIYKPADVVTRGAMAAFLFRLDQFLNP